MQHAVQERVAIPLVKWFNAQQGGLRRLSHDQVQAYSSATITNDRHNSGCGVHSPPTPCVAWLVQKVVKRPCRVSVSSPRGLGGLTSVRGRLRPCATFSSLKIEWRHLRSRGRCCRRTAPFIEGGGFLPTGPLGVDRLPIPHDGRRVRAAGIAHRAACLAPTETANDDRGSGRPDAPTRSSQTSPVA